MLGVLVILELVVKVQSVENTVFGTIQTCNGGGYGGILAIWCTGTLTWTQVVQTVKMVVLEHLVKVMLVVTSLMGNRGYLQLGKLVLVVLVGASATLGGNGGAGLTLGL